MAWMEAKRTSPEGHVNWRSDQDLDKFDGTFNKFPVLGYVIETYFATPERKNRDYEFLENYKENGEDSGDFVGLKDDLDNAIRDYSAATYLINGATGAIHEADDVRSLLVSLRDQITESGEFDPANKYKDDPYLIDSAKERMDKTFFKRAVEFPVWPLKGKIIPLPYVLIAGFLLFSIGFGLGYVPIIGKIGGLFLFVGLAIMLYVAITFTTGRNIEIAPAKAAAQEKAIEDAVEKRKKKQEDKKANGRGNFLQRFGSRRD